MPNGPLPPPELAGYVLGLPQADLDEHLEMGRHLHDRILELVPELAWDGARVLDFGCGTARVLRHFVDLAPGTELHGVELDARCVDWVRANLAPPLRVERSAEEPPLPYPDAHFDLVWAMSVLPHLPDTWAAWLLELRRVVKPGGLVLATVLGGGAAPVFTDEPWSEDDTGLTVLGYGRPWSAGGAMMLQSRWWTQAHWGRAFTVERHLPGGIAGQDAVLLRRDDRPAPTVAELEAPEPDEPRELCAARRAIGQLHREHARLNAAHDAYAEAYALEAAQHAVTRQELARLRASPREPRLVRAARRLEALRHRP